MNTPHAPVAPADDHAGDITAKQFAIGLACVAGVALLLRLLFPLADPPWHTPVGVVWHDEGAWTHNARNRALFGVWQLDAWNPMFLAPVFTGLEYLSFWLLGTGLWQARIVSEIAGFSSVLLLALAMRRAANRTTGLVAGALMATNYVWVMWSRAALMEASMVAFMVAAFYAYVRASRTPAWGLIAGLCAVVAFFTKASAAFFLVALGVEALVALAIGWPRGHRDPDGTPAAKHARRAAVFTLAGLAVSSIVAAAVFVIPYWTEFRFYNWQMSVTRKPSYSLRAFRDRLSWFPIVHDFFTRMWMMLLLAMGGLTQILVRWRTAMAAERLLVLWFALGCAELLVHDVGNERRLVFLIPPLAGLAALVLGRDRRLLPTELATVPLRKALIGSPYVLLVFYLLIGSIVRLAFLYEVQPGVRAAALGAVVLTALMYGTWPRMVHELSKDRWPERAVVLLLAMVLTGDVLQYAQWAASRTFLNYEAMLAVGQALPPGTLVHGKLANGLALENRIRPVFIGRGFGNYDDRLTRDDIKYVLTYTRPSVGYEGPVIRDVLEAYRWHVVRRFSVAESPEGDDEAVLIQKDGPRQRR